MKRKMNVKNHKKIYIQFLYIAVVITTIAYIVWRAFFTIPFELGLMSLIFGLLLFLSEVLGAIETIQHCYGMGEEIIPELPIIDKSDYPDIDVFIATYNETAELLYKTINGCQYMKYPDLSKVHIYILDDGNRLEIQQLADKMGVGYINRATHEHAKAGNLNNALQYTNSPLIATFDADMIPLSDFLMKTVPYFFLPQYQNEDNQWIKRSEVDKSLKIGFIQTPQCFYNPDLFQYNLFSEHDVPNEQDYFYRDVQLARNKTNSAIYGGSNTVISRQALEEIGGFFTGVITEDFATGISIQSNGYTCYAVKDVLAIGLSPTDIKSLIKQRERWARGCIQTLRRVRILTKKGLSLSQKISYLSSLLYWYTSFRRIMYILAPILFAVFQIQVVSCSLMDLLIWWLPQYLVYWYAIKKFSGEIRTNRLSNIYDTILFPSLLPAVILETFGISQDKFSVTIKERVSNDKIYQLKQSFVHILFLVLSIIGVSISIHKMFVGEMNTYVIVFFWLVINLYSLLMAIFFMMGREYYRQAERFYIEKNIKVSDYSNLCITQDLSDHGLSFFCQFPLYISPKEIIKVIIDDIEIHGRVKHVEEINNQWKYGMYIDYMEEEMKKKYYHLIYDRHPTLPSQISNTHSFFDELSHNILKRAQKAVTFNRQIARVQLNRKLMTNDKQSIVCRNFNYEYILLEGNQKILKNKIILDVGNHIFIECYKEKSFHHQSLYKIENYKELINNSQFLLVLEEWIHDEENWVAEKEEKEENKEFDERLYY